MRKFWSSQNQFRNLIAGGLLFLTLLFLVRRHLRNSLSPHAFFTGWFLFLIIIALAAYNARKRLAMLPLARSATWLRLHVVGGLVCVAVFWLHTGRLWPGGAYLQTLAFLFYAVSVSGLMGFVLQRIYPPLLTATRLEILYERIPYELARLREQAEVIVLNCTRDTGSDTLARHYVETLDWYFRRPRFVFFHMLGTEKAESWQRRKCDTVRRYLNETERRFLAELTELAEKKTKIDFHFAAQLIMKGWLFLHIPLAAALLALALWHILLVYIYAA